MDRVAIPLKPNSQNTVVFTEDTVSSDGISIPYADVLGITFFSEGSRASIIDSTSGTLILSTATIRMSLFIRNWTFFWNDVNQGSNYAKICEQVMTRIAPSVLQRLATSILSGGSVSIGSLTLDSDGVTCTGTFGRRRRATWDLLPEVRATTKNYWLAAMAQSGILEVSYFHPPTGKMIVVGSATSRDENGCLLSPLIRFMTSLHKAENA